jgi:hypothetical protein
MSKSTLRVLIVAMTTACATQIVHAQFQPEFEFTENSSLLLIVTYGGNPLVVTPTPGSPDSWSFVLPLSFVPYHNQQWTERENASLVNTVYFQETSGTGFVRSDFARDTSIPEAADGERVLVGFHENTGVPVFGTFHDNAATAEAAVPDTGTTCSLLGLSLIGLAFLRRKLC